MKRHSHKGSQARQQGLVLIIALIALVAMTLAGIAMVRSVDIATQIAGNLGFRQSGTQSADAGAEMGRKWLMATAAGTLWNDKAPSYYATWGGGGTGSPPIFDPLTFDWSGKASQAEDSSGNTVSYVIHRMCETTGDPQLTATNCITAPVSSSAGGGTLWIGKSGCTAATCSGTGSPYYRITARSKGPRDTYTYTQIVLY